jgi:hypothetical protein
MIATSAIQVRARKRSRWGAQVWMNPRGHFLLLHAGNGSLYSSKTVKTRSKTFIFWAALGVTWNSLLIWVLAKTALGLMTRAPRAFWILWIIPLTVSLLPVVFLNACKDKPEVQRIAVARYLALYLPWVVLPLVAVVYGSGRWQYVPSLVALPFLVWMPFRYSKQFARIDASEGGTKI